MSVIEPYLKDDAFLEQVRECANLEPGFQLWWLGQSGFLVQWRDWNRTLYLLLDPYLSDSLTEKYANTPKPHVRVTARVIAPERLDFIGVVSSSHNHTDHLDALTLKAIFEASPRARLLIPEANRDFVVERLGCDPDFPVGLDAGQEVSLKAFRFHAVPAAHERIERDGQNRCQFLGYVVQFGGWTIYHSGDTVWHDEIISALEGFRIDLAILPINGSGHGVSGNLDGPQAARFARAIGARVAIPCHFEMFEFNTASPEAFEHEARAIGQPVKVLRAGESFSSAELEAYT